MTDFLTSADVLAIHTDQIERYGGSHGLRDSGLLEAALFRPQTGYYEDLIEEAAALWESLAMNHGFVDGNKRVAYACVEIFLALNGLEITGENDTIETFIYANLEGGTFNKDVLDAWLRANTGPRG